MALVNAQPVNPHSQFAVSFDEFMQQYGSRCPRSSEVFAIQTRTGAYLAGTRNWVNLFNTRTFPFPLHRNASKAKKLENRALNQTLRSVDKKRALGDKMRH